MQPIVDTIPLKPGKLEAYKKFTAEITGPRQKEFADLLNRYGLKTVNTSYQTIGGITFIIVVHIAEDDALEKLAHFEISQHPMDKWFVEQLIELHDYAPLSDQGQRSHPISYFEPEKI